jgi:hypothetical protein
MLLILQGFIEITCPSAAIQYGRKNATQFNRASNLHQIKSDVKRGDLCLKKIFFLIFPSTHRLVVKTGKLQQRLRFR